MIPGRLNAEVRSVEELVRRAAQLSDCSHIGLTASFHHDFYGRIQNGGAGAALNHHAEVRGPGSQWGWLSK